MFFNHGTRLIPVFAVTPDCMLEHATICYFGVKGRPSIDRVLGCIAIQQLGLTVFPSDDDAQPLEATAMKSHDKPSVDVIHRPEDILVRADMPGDKKEDLDISILDKMVTVS